MRLVCPNCEAKYEVPEDAIPETGRDVQCANCGHAWFQMRPRAAGAETAISQPPAPPVAERAVETVVEPVAERVAEPSIEVDTTIPAPVADVAGGTEALTDPSPDGEVAQGEAKAAPTAEPVEDDMSDAAPVTAQPAIKPDLVEEVEAEATVSAAAEHPAADEPGVPDRDESAVSAIGIVPAVEAAVAEAVVAEDAVITDGLNAAEAAAAAPAAYAVDESVLAILREEAEREAHARRAEAAKPLETQTDLGIETSIPAARRTVEAASAAEFEVDDKFATRRTRLPDVEEINSTLRPTETAQDGSGASDTEPVMVEGRSSFRSGFLLVLTVAILGSALYGSADALAEAVPALAGPLKAYIGFVDSLRLHLDGLMQSATVAINGN